MMILKRIVRVSESGIQVVPYTVEGNLITVAFGRPFSAVVQK